MEVRRKAGDMINRVIDSLRGIDDDYTTRINDMYKGSGPIMEPFGAIVGGGYPSLRKGEIDQDVYGPERRITQGARNALEYALPAISVVPKYVIPAAGVALAGRGVMDIAAGFGGPADQQESGQITINDLSPAAQSLIKGNPGEQIVAGMRGYGAYANLSQSELEQMLEAVNNTAFYQ
jgi:hypothetical protein